MKGGKPVKIQEIADRLGRNRRSVERNLRRLGKYLDIRRTPYGLAIRIRNPKKWFRHDKSVASRERYDKNVTTDLSETKKTNTNKHTVEQRTLDRSRRIFYPVWFEEFWKAYPSNRGSKKAGFTQAKKFLKSESDIRVALDLLNLKADQPDAGGREVGRRPSARPALFQPELVGLASRSGTNWG